LRIRLKELILKSNIFRTKVEEYAGMGITSVVIEEPLLNSNNVYTVGTLMRFNTLVCKEVYDILGIMPQFISTYNSRKFAFPEPWFKRTIKENSFLFGGLTKRL
jgi:hypothetical protein